jgi:hypothetical protein
LRSFYTDTITRIRPVTASDSWGNQSQTSTTSAPISGCRVQSLRVEERLMADQTMSEVELRVFAPPGSDVKVTDFVDWAGNRYRVHGEPQEFRSPNGQTNHLLIGLVRVDG